MHSDPPQDRIPLARGQWIVRLFGGFFAAMGGLFLVMLLHNPAAVKVNGRPGTTDDAWFPLIPIAIGLAIAGIRFGAYLDLGRRLRVSWWGWWFWTRTQEDSLGTWQRFELSGRQRRGSGKNARWVIPLLLISDRGTTELTAPSDEVQARRLAERFARATGLPLREHGPGGAVERPADQIDRRLLDRITATDLDVRQPPDSRVQRVEGLRSTVLRVGASPLMRFSPFLALPLLVPVLFWWFLWYPGLRDEAHQSWFRWAFAMAPLLMALPVVAIALRVAWRHGLFGTTVSADPDEGIRSSGGRLTIDEIEDIRLHGEGRQACLVIISDRRWLRVGFGLTPEDLRYLRACLLTGLRGNR